MSNITRFPPRLRSVKAVSVADADMAAAQIVSGFFATALPELQLVAGAIEARLEKLTLSEVFAINATVQTAINGGEASSEEFMLAELVTKEFERRCLLAGTPVPWSAEYEADLLAEAGLLEANDNPVTDPKGAA